MRQITLTATLILSLLMLASCSWWDSASTETLTPKERRDQERDTGSLITGKRTSGISLSDLVSGNDGESGLPVNALLWRASLDTLAVVPLVSIDTFSGSIISDWYVNPDNATQRIKIVSFVLGQELRSDGIKVEVYVQNRSENLSEWIQAGRDAGLANRLEELILTRAREIRSTGISEIN